MRRAPILLIPLLLLVVGVTAGPPALASAGPGPTPQATGKTAGTAGRFATYNGRVIDLSKGWQGATVCTWYSRDDVRCHATLEAALAEDLLLEGKAATAEPIGTASASQCTSGWFCLFSDSGWFGDLARFREPGPCQALAPWGFNNVASSWVNRLPRVVTIADGSSCNSTSLIVPGNAQGGSMGTMNNKASSIRIN